MSGGSSEELLRLRGGGDVHHRAHEQLSAPFAGRDAGHDVKMLDRSIGHQQPVLKIEAVILFGRALDRLPDESDVIRVHPLK